MRKAISPGNPFGPRLAHAYAYEFVSPGMRLLDYGCNSGAFIGALSDSKKVEAYGVDKNCDLVAALDNPKIRHVDGRIPFTEGTFDVVTVLDVLEHVYDQEGLLAEIHRTLKESGLVVVTVPRQHIFSFLDHGNFKYRFPYLHKFWYTRKHSPEDYEYRYINNPNGLIGDVDREKAWHQHFREKELRQLLEQTGFDVVDIDGCGLFNFLMIVLGFLGIKFSDRFWAWQDRKFQSCMIFCVARKRALPLAPSLASRT